MKYSIHKIINISITLAVICLTLFLVYIFTMLQLSVVGPRFKARCSDFTSYKDAMQALQKGDSWLDRNKDGMPCQNLK